MKLLVTRTDRLGDLVLALPVFALIKRERPDWSLHAMVGPASVPVVENDPHLDAIWTWSDTDPASRREELEAQLRDEGFDAVVLLQYRRELATMFRRAGIRQRYGPLSKWSSWFLLNRGSRQARSRKEIHETDQNLCLIQRIMEAVPEVIDTAPLPRIFLADSQLEYGRSFVRREAGNGSRIVFVHPGSGGSALDWEPSRFAAVANGLAGSENTKVFITGAGSDRTVIDQMADTLQSDVRVLLDRFSLREFLGVLAAGDLFIGPSTGPLHLASALGLSVVGLFPPVRTMGPGRWGPRGKRANHLVPEVDCPASRICFGSRCQHFNCLARISTDRVLAMASNPERKEAGK